MNVRPSAARQSNKICSSSPKATIASTATKCRLKLDSAGMKGGAETVSPFIPRNLHNSLAGPDGT